MMELRMLLLLLLHLHLGNSPRTEDGQDVQSLNVVYVSLPAPSSVSISSFNMEHVLSFLPGPGTPSNTSFSVQVICPRKNSWRPVAACSQLTSGQQCNLTKVFKDPFDHYQARVQAFTSNQTSSWTVSESFQPLSDTVLGPPDVTVSGCGNCLIVKLTVPERELQQDLQLKNLYKGTIFHVQRTRDGVQFTLTLPYKEENTITYLQPGVEYCVTVSAKGLFNHDSIFSKPYCAFTSPPTPKSSNAMYVVFSLLGVFCMLGFIGLVYGGQLRLHRIAQRLPRRLSNIFTQCHQHRRAQPEYSGQFSASQLQGSANCLLTAHGPDQAQRISSEEGERDCGAQPF